MRIFSICTIVFLDFLGPVEMLISLQKKEYSPLQSSSIAILSLIAISVLLINTFIEPDRFADYFSYIELVDRYYFFRDENWFLFEPVSTSIFLILKYFFVSTELSVNIAHFILGIFYVGIITFISVKYSADWRSILICFCVFGALMAFVTIRATPAYFFVTIAFMESLRNNKKAVLYVFVAALFHMSAILALIPLILSLLQNKFSTLSWVYFAGRRAFFTLIGALGLIAFLRSFFQEFIYTFINSVPILSRYLVYVYSISANSVNISTQAEEVSIFHTIYLVLCSIFVLALITNQSDICRRSRLYIFSSYLVFLLMQFSPVTAFRQSMFWMLPAIFVFPWTAYTVGRFGAFPLVAGALLIFLYQLSTLIV